MRSKTIRRRTITEMNVVPYIDVMLVLLVIFMITTPLLTQGVKIDLPKAKAQAIDTENREPLIISVDEKGQYFLNVAEKPTQPMDPETLATRIAAEIALAKRGGYTRGVFVKGDRNVNYGRVVRAMALLQNAGAKSVGLLTKTPEGQA